MRTQLLTIVAFLISVISVDADSYQVYPHAREVFASRTVHVASNVEL